MNKNRPKPRKNTNFITLDGVTKSIHEWSEESETPVPTIVKRLQRKWGALEAIFCPTEDPEFELARKTICAHANKTRIGKKSPGSEVALFNVWAAMMRRAGNEHMIYQQAISIAKDNGQLPKDF